MENIEEIRRNGLDPTRVKVDELAPIDNYDSKETASDTNNRRADRSR